MPDLKVKLVKTIVYECEVEIPDCESEDVADKIAAAWISDLDSGEEPKIDDEPVTLNWEEESTTFDHEETWED
jgi:hypothetical protein